MLPVQVNDSARWRAGQRYSQLFKHAPICIVVVDLTVNPPTVLVLNKLRLRI